MEAEKKVCIVITQPEWGGAQRYVYDLAQGLSEYFTVTVATGRGEPVLLQKLNNKGVTTHQFAHVVRAIRPLEEFHAFFELRNYFKEGKFDVVHLNSSKIGVLGAAAAKSAGVKKVVFTAHGFHFNEKLSFLGKIFSLCATWFGFLFTDKVITVSGYDRTSALKYHVCSPGKITTIHNGIDIGKEKFLSKESARDFLKTKGVAIREDTKIIGAIGNLYKNKGFIYLVEAMAKLKQNILCVILGEGEERNKIEKLIKKYGLQDKVYLLGFIKDAEQYLKGFDVCVSSSLKEGLPYNLLEAHMLSVPIVATHVGGVSEIVGENGILVEPEKPHDLARAIQTILSQPKEYVSQKGKFSLSRMIHETIDIYEK